MVGSTALDVEDGRSIEQVEATHPQAPSFPRQQSVTRREDPEQARQPLSTSKRSIQQTMDEMTGLIDNAALVTRVAWVRDAMDRVTVDGREAPAVATWRRHPTTVLIGRIQ